MKAKLRIFVDCHVFDGSFQGTTTYIQGVYKELIKDKNIVFFFAANDIGRLQAVFGTAENIFYLKYRSKNKFYRLAFDIPKLIQKHKIDYAHFQYIVPPIKYCKYIVTVHDVLFLDYPEYFPLSYRLKNKMLFQWSVNYSDIVLTVSDYSKQKIQEHFGIKDVVITPNAVNPVFFEEYDKVKVVQEVKRKYNLENYWIYISRWEPRKNHHALLKVFIENEYYKKYSLVLIGDQSISNTEFKMLYDGLDESVKKTIFILKKVRFSKLILLLRGATLAVYPSIAEGFGIPPLETSAAGISTICSNTTAMSDFIFFKNRLFNPCSENDFNEKIKFGLQNKQDDSITDTIRNTYRWELSAAIFKKKIVPLEE